MKRPWTPSFTAACTRGDDATARHLARTHSIPRYQMLVRPPAGYGTHSTTTQRTHTRTPKASR